MKAASDDRRIDPAVRVMRHSAYRGASVDDKWGFRGHILDGFLKVKRIRAIRHDARGQPLQLRRGLAFIRYAVACPCQDRYSVEESTGAGSQRRIELTVGRLSDNAEGCCRSAI